MSLSKLPKLVNDFTNDENTLHKIKIKNPKKKKNYHESKKQINKK
jgi:glycine cleavage system H lipoate-binding protein